MTHTPTAYTVCNIDGVPIATYDTRADARAACRDLAIACANANDLTNGYYVEDDAEFHGVMASEVAG